MKGAVKSPEEARKCFCPMTMNNPGRDDIEAGPHHCVAEECMAWRWYNQISDQGFCGIAGTP
jgi:hypothetical protein